MHRAGRFVRDASARLGQTALAVAVMVLAAAAAPGQGRPSIVWMAGGHSGGVSSVALSPNNQVLASASYDATAKLFDVSTSILQRTLIGHDVVALSVAYSPDGTRVVTGGYEGTARVWDVSTGALIGTLSGHSGSVNSVAYSPDGTMIATGSSDNTVGLWDAAAGTLIGTLAGHTGEVYSVAFAPDSATLASGSGDSTIKVWRVSDGALLQTLIGHAGMVLSVDFSPSGAELASGSTDDTVKRWRVADGALLHSYTDQTLYIYAVAFTPDGLSLGSGAGDGTAILRRLSDGVIQQTFTADGGVLSLAFTSDSATLITGLDNGMIGLWNTGDGAFVKYVTHQWGVINGLAISSDSARVASVADDGSAALHQASDGSALLSIAAHPDIVSSVALSPDGALLATGSHDYTAAIWDAGSGALVHTLAAHTDTVLAVAFSPDGATLVTGGSDSAIRIWRVADGAEIGGYVGHTGAVWSLAFSPDGERLVSGSADGTVRCWKTADQSQVWEQVGADTVVTCVAVSPDGATVASGSAVSATGTLKLWSLADGTALVTSTGHLDPIRSAAFAPDGLVLATGSSHGNEGRLQFWHVPSLALLQTYNEETGTSSYSDGVTAVAFTPDNTRLAYGRSDGTVVMIDNPFWPAPTTLAAGDVTGQIGELVQLNATLTTLLSGAPVLGKSVDFSVAGTAIGSAPTDGTGTARIDYRIPEAFGLGVQTIGASYQGDMAYSASSDTATLTITQANTSINVSPAAGILGDSVTLSANLRRTTDDQVLAGRTLVFEVEGTSAGSGTTDASGNVQIDYVIPLDIGAGAKVIKVDFAGDATHKVCTAYGALTTELRPTTTTMAAASGMIGETILFTATVDFRGSGVQGVTVAFAVEGTSIGSGLTDSSGVAGSGYLIPEGSGAGTRSVEASFGGTAIYASSSDTDTLTVLQTGTQLYVPDLTRAVDVGGTAVLRAYLLRAPGTDRGYIAGRTISFTVGGVAAGTAVTDESGRATGSYVIPEGSSTGDLVVQASFAGDATYLPSQGSGLLTVNVSRSNTSLWVLPRLGVQGAALYLRSYLRRTTDGAWLPGKTVAYSVDGSAVGSADTDGNGRASLYYLIPNGMSDGAHTTSCTFNGDADYNGVTSTGVLFIL